MIIGDPYKLAFIIDRVPAWECEGFLNGILFICVNGTPFPPEIRTTTLNGDLYQMLVESSPINRVKEDRVLYQLEAAALFNKLCDITYPQEDRDNDDSFLVPTREMNDAGYSMFTLGYGETVKCLIGKHGAEHQCMQEIELCKAELADIVNQLKGSYRGLLKETQGFVCHPPAG